MTSLRMELWDEWTAYDAWGRPKPGDLGPSGRSRRIQEVFVPRGGYASIRVLVEGRGAFRLCAEAPEPLEVDLYRAWYHRATATRRGRPAWCYADALIPCRTAEAFQIPDPDARIPGQTAQEFWLDIYAPPDAAAALPRTVTIRLRAGADEIFRQVGVTVLTVCLPDPPRFLLDNNSYGCRWLAAQYPRCLSRDPCAPDYWNGVIDLLHHYYRLAHEHRMSFHNLGYGHSGDFDPIYGPRAVGVGRKRHLTAWDLFDRYHGPLLDGRAFSVAAPQMPRPRRRPLPVWGIYTPINPDWPARYVAWGDSGYAVEFIQGLREFDAHFRRHRWMSSRLELFFNHKKRYRWFEWDGDEVKYAKDDAYHLEMIRLWREAVGDSPVPWVYRVDASWRVRDQLDRLACGRNFWVIGGFCAWYPRQVRRMLQRGDFAVNYGGYPEVPSPLGRGLVDVFRAWARGLHGFCEWLATQPGQDPWFACNGAATGVFYPGERFGIFGPLPSIRLKVMRNAIQDLDLLTEREAAEGDRRGRAALARRVGVALWETPPPAAQKLPPEDWDGDQLRKDHQPTATALPKLPPDWWRGVRRQAFRMAAGKEAPR